MSSRIGVKRIFPQNLLPCMVRADYSCTGSELFTPTINLNTHRWSSPERSPQRRKCLKVYTLVTCPRQLKSRPTPGWSTHSSCPNRQCGSNAYNVKDNWRNLCHSGCKPAKEYCHTLRKSSSIMNGSHMKNVEHQRTDSQHTTHTNVQQLSTKQVGIP